MNNELVIPASKQTQYSLRQNIFCETFLFIQTSKRRTYLPYTQIFHYLKICIDKNVSTFLQFFFYFNAAFRKQVIVFSLEKSGQPGGERVFECSVYSLQQDF